MTLRLALASLLSLSAFASTPSQFGAAVSSGRRQLAPGPVPSLVAHLQPITHLAEINTLHLALGLPLRNRKDLSKLLHDLYSPGNPEFHHYLTPEQFTERFGPSERDYKAVLDFALRHHLAVRGTHANRMLVDVSGSVSDIERAFHVRLNSYDHPTEKRTFYAPDVEPSVEPGVPIQDILGLSNYSPPHRVGPPKNAKRKTPGAGPNLASGPFGLFTAADLRKAYIPGVTNIGAGQIVAMVEFDGYDPASIASYEATNGLSPVSLTNILIDGVSGTPSSKEYEIEVTMDIELAIAMAPGVSQVRVYEGPPGSDGASATAYSNDVLNRIATDNLARQISSSWSWGGGPNSTTDQIFQEFAAQGQTYLNASGDYGASSDAVGNPLGGNDAPMATSPYITLVGGTTLTTSLTGDWTSEVVWNWEAGISSAGAVSTTYAIPDYQLGIDMSASGGSTRMRNMPDISMVADSCYIDSPGSNAGAGTSAATPLLAGLIALVNEQAAANGQPSIGFLNPAIYRIGKSPAYRSCFHDITVGNNTNVNNATGFYAVPGYDLCTGWGSPAGQGFINALAPGALTLSPDLVFHAREPLGGPFSPASQDLTLTNSGPTPLPWSLGVSARWLTASPTSGTLLAGGPSSTITVSLTSAALQLTPGYYSAAVSFTNQNNGIWQSRFYSLTVTGATTPYGKAVLSLNPAGYWPLNETNQPPPAKVVTNSSPLGLAAYGAGFGNIVCGQTGIVSASYRFSNPALTVTLLDSHIDIPYQSALNPGGPFTVELWVKPAQTTTDWFSPAASVDRTQNSSKSRYGWIFYQIQNQWEFSVGNSSGYVATLDGGFASTNTWHHLVGVYDGSNVSLYVDGVQVAGPATASGFSPNTRAPIRLGASNVAGRGYDGWVDEVAFYGTNLDAATIAAHYSTAINDAGNYPHLVLAANPLGYWQLNEPATPANASTGLPIAMNLGSLETAANGVYSPGTLPGASGVPGAAFGAANMACHFTGVGSVTIPPTGLAIGGPLTVSAWVNASPSDPANPFPQTIIAKGTAGYQISLDTAGYPHFTDGIQPPGDLVGTNSITDNQWHYLTGTWDGGDVERLYVDGQRVASTSSAYNSPQTDGTALMVGGGPDARLFRVYNCVIDEVAIFTNALSDAQIASLYAAASPPPTALLLTASLAANGTVALSWNASVGSTYQVQYKNALSESNWTNLGGPLVVTSNTSPIINDNSAVAPQRFYRLMLLP